MCILFIKYLNKVVICICISYCKYLRLKKYIVFTMKICIINCLKWAITLIDIKRTIAMDITNLYIGIYSIYTSYMSSRTPNTFYKHLYTFIHIIIFYNTHKHIIILKNN